MMELMSGLDVTSLFAMTVVVGLVAMAATRRTRNSNRWTVGSVDTSRAAVQQWSTAAPMSLDSADMHNGVTAATPVRQVVSAKDDSNGDGFRATKEFLKHGTRRGSGGLDMSQTSLMSNESSPSGATTRSQPVGPSKQLRRTAPTSARDQTRTSRHVLLWQSRAEAWPWSEPALPAASSMQQSTRPRA